MYLRQNIHLQNLESTSIPKQMFGWEKNSHQQHPESHAPIMVPKGTKGMTLGSARWGQDININI